MDNCIMPQLLFFYTDINGKPIDTLKQTVYWLCKECEHIIVSPPHRMIKAGLSFTDRLERVESMVSRSEMYFTKCSKCGAKPRAITNEKDVIIDVYTPVRLLQGDEIDIHLFREGLDKLIQENQFEK